MRTHTDSAALIDRGRGPASVLIGLKIRHLGAVVPSAERRPTGCGPNADAFARQIFWGASS
jgi:hypothetical protein